MGRVVFKRKAGINAVAYSYLVQALLTGPRSKADLEEITGMGPNAVARCIKALRDRGLLPIVGWRPDARGRMTVREYRLAPNYLLTRPTASVPDAPCPKMDRQEVLRRYFDKRRRLGLPLRIRNYQAKDAT